jgi:hypothetical protein
MDVNLIRSVIEVLVFGAFVGIACWAYLPSRKDKQQRIAQSIVGEDS